jgi:hypothetical protein
MNRLILAALLAGGCRFGAVHAAPGPTEPALRDELLQMKERDQAVREVSDKGDFSKLAQIDAVNQKRVKEIVAHYGWPTISMVGKEGASAAWLIAQHSDRDPDFQQQVLALMEPLVKRGEASGTDYAYLYDRTHYPQRFGTQGRCVSREAWHPLEIEDVAHVNERRRELGMPSMADYVKLFKKACANPSVVLHGADDPKRTVPVPES